MIDVVALQRKLKRGIWKADWEKPGTNHDTSDRQVHADILQITAIVGGNCNTVTGAL